MEDRYPFHAAEKDAGDLWRAHFPHLALAQDQDIVFWGKQNQKDFRGGGPAWLASALSQKMFHENQNYDFENAVWQNAVMLYGYDNLRLCFLLEITPGIHPSFADVARSHWRFFHKIWRGFAGISLSQRHVAPAYDVFLDAEKILTRPHLAWADLRKIGNQLCDNTPPQKQNDKAAEFILTLFPFTPHLAESLRGLIWPDLPVIDDYRA